MASNQNRIPNTLSPEQKKKILKAVIVIALIILVFSFISRFAPGRGQTLLQYAAENPDVTYGTESAD